MTMYLFGAALMSSGGKIDFYANESGDLWKDRSVLGLCVVIAL